MILLDVNRRLFTLLCICPPRQPIKKTEQIRNIICSIALGIFLVSPLTASLIAFYRFMMIDDLDNALYALTQVAGTSSGIYLYISAFLMRSDINEFFDRFDKIYDSCEYHDDVLSVFVLIKFLIYVLII